MAERRNPFWTEYEGAVHSYAFLENPYRHAGRCGPCQGTSFHCVTTGSVKVSRNDAHQLIEDFPGMALRNARALIDRMHHEMAFHQYAVDRFLLPLAEEYWKLTGAGLSEKQEANFMVMRDSAEQNTYMADALRAAAELRADLDRMLVNAPKPPWQLQNQPRQP